MMVTVQSVRLPAQAHGATQSPPQVAIQPIRIPLPEPRLELALNLPIPVHAGVVSAYMNTAGQIGGVLSPVILAYVLTEFGSWNAPLYFTAVLYVFGALMWFGINAEHPIFERHPD